MDATIGSYVAAVRVVVVFDGIGGLQNATAEKDVAWLWRDFGFNLDGDANEERWKGFHFLLKLKACCC